MATETVLIEFQIDDSQLVSALERLEKSGSVDLKMATAFKTTNAEISKQSAEIKKAAASTAPLKKNLEDVNKATKKFTQDFVAGFQDGVQDALREAGVSAEEFQAALNNANSSVTKSSGGLRTQLKGIVQQMAEMKLRGEDNTEQYQKLAQKAGEMKDAIGDAASEVKNFGSDTKNIDGLISLTQGLAGGFALVQGAEGLFGEESEELQQTLLKVNSAMAVLQGLQQVGNVLQKESAAGTFLQTAAQKIYNVVVGESIGLMAAFRIALAATGVGLLIIGIIALVAALDKQDKQLKKVNNELDRNKNIIEADKAAIEDLTEKELARAAAVGAAEIELTSIRGRGLLQQRKSIEEANAKLAEQRDVLDSTSEGYLKLNQAIEDNNGLIKGIDNKLKIEQINFDKQRKAEALQAIADRLEAELQGTTKNSAKELQVSKELARAKAAVELNAAGDNLAKRLLIEKNLQKQIRDLNRTFAQEQQQDKIDAAERSLLSVQQKSKAINERTSQDEIDAQKRVIREKARLELLQEGLTQNQRNKIIEQALADQLQLQKDFNKQSAADVLADQIDRNNTELSQLNITNSDKLALQEENLIIQAQQEIDANAGLTDKIKAIRAKLNEDLRALRLSAVEKELEDELAATQVRTGALRRANEGIAANESKAIKARIAAVNQLAALDIAAINDRQDALDKELREKLISQEEYKAKYAKLVDDETKIVEDAEKKKTDLTKEQNRLREEVAFAALYAIATVISDINASQTEQNNQRIEGERKRVAELLEAGAITEEEAKKRNKRIDTEEKKLKREQAQREKNLALFNAVINTASAITKALASAPPPYNAILAGISAALGLAQIAIINNRPLPKFAKGKKDRYEGPGEIGEAGAELMEHNGQLYLAKKRTLVWLGKDDKVYNPTETKEMLMPTVDKQLMQWQAPVQKQPDAKEIAAELAKQIKKIPSTNVNIDEHGLKVWVQEGMSRQNYMDKRYSSK